MTIVGQFVQADTLGPRWTHVISIQHFLAAKTELYHVFQDTIPIVPLQQHQLQLGHLMNALLVGNQLGEELVWEWKKEIFLCRWGVMDHKMRNILSKRAAGMNLVPTNV